MDLNKPLIISGLAALTLSAAFKFAAEIDPMGLSTITKKEISKREDEVRGFRALNPDNAACQKALDNLEGPYIHQRKNYLLLWKGPTTLDAYRNEYDQTIKICDKYPEAPISSTPQYTPQIRSIKPLTYY